MKFSVAFLTAALAGSVLARPSTLAARVQSRADGTRRHRTQPMVKVGSNFKEDAKFIEGGTSIHYLEAWMAQHKR